MCSNWPMNFRKENPRRTNKFSHEKSSNWFDFKPIRKSKSSISTVFSIKCHFYSQYPCRLTYRFSNLNTVIVFISLVSAIMLLCCSLLQLQFVSNENKLFQIHHINVKSLKISSEFNAGNWYRGLCGYSSSNIDEFHAVLLDILTMQQWQWGVNRIWQDCKCIFPLFVVVDAKQLVESNDSYFGLFTKKHRNRPLWWISLRSWNFQPGIHEFMDELYISIQMLIISS